MDRRELFENLLDNFNSVRWHRFEVREAFGDKSKFVSIAENVHTGQNWFGVHETAADALLHLSKDLDTYKPRYVINLTSGVAYRPKVRLDLGEVDESLVGGYGGE